MSGLEFYNGFAFFQIFDINTGQSIAKLTPRITNQYTKNKATFSFNDELVLSDGVLFDVASGKAIHKLDKLNQTQSGVFHPNGLEVSDKSCFNKLLLIAKQK